MTVVLAAVACLALFVAGVLVVPSYLDQRRSTRPGRHRVGRPVRGRARVPEVPAWAVEDTQYIPLWEQVDQRTGRKTWWRGLGGAR